MGDQQPGQQVEPTEEREGETKPQRKVSGQQAQGCSAAVGQESLNPRREATAAALDIEASAQPKKYRVSTPVRRRTT